MSDEAKGLLGFDVAIDPGNQPLPACARCGRDMPFFYAFIHNLAMPDGSGTLQIQSYCCPYAACRATIVSMPIGVIPGKVTAPGRPGWGGKPM